MSCTTGITTGSSTDDISTFSCNERLPSVAAYQGGATTAVSSEVLCLRLDLAEALLQVHSPVCQSKQRAEPSS